MYIHTDALASLLRWSFDVLWRIGASSPNDFEIDRVTYYLHQDLPTVCQEVFITRQIGDEEASREYFLQKAMEALLPTILAMGGMITDREMLFSARYKYERAYLTGLAIYSNYTTIIWSPMVCATP